MPTSAPGCCSSAIAMRFRNSTDIRLAVAKSSLRSGADRGANSEFTRRLRAGAGLYLPSALPFADDRCKVERRMPISIEGGTVACRAIEQGRLPVKERTCVASSGRG